MTLLSACSGDGSTTGMEPDNGPGPMPLPPAPACTPASGGGGKTVSAPELLLTLKDRYEEAWLGSAAVADLNGNQDPDYRDVPPQTTRESRSHYSQYGPSAAA